MRFGPPPPLRESRDISNWERIEGTDVTRWDIAVPAGAAAFGATALAWWAITGAKPVVFTDPFWFGFVLFAAALLAHELLHYIAMPIGEKGGGIWPSKGICYVYYHGVMTRTQSAFVYLIPTLVITVGPLLYAAAGGAVPWWVQFMSIWNAVGAGFDLQHSWFLLRKTKASDNILWWDESLWREL